MRAFDDICVLPGFDEVDHERSSALRKSVAVGVLVAAVGTSVAVATGTMPEIPGVDAYVSHFVQRSRAWADAGS